jgi:hypothetical protein
MQRSHPREGPLWKTKHNPFVACGTADGVFDGSTVNGVRAISNEASRRKVLARELAHK